jgi:hypothetical protein
MNLISVPTSELKDELERRNGVFYRGAFKHEKECDSSSVNPRYRMVWRKRSNDYWI